MMLSRKIAIVCILYLIFSSGAAAQEEKIKMAIVSPGGPSPKKVEKYIGQFSDLISEQAGLGKGSVTGLR